MLQVAGDGYKRGTAAAVTRVSRVELGNPHRSVQCCKCHISTTVGCHYVTQVDVLVRKIVLVKAGHWDVPGDSC